MAFNLNKLALEEKASIQLKHPATEQELFADDDESKPVMLVMKGAASQAYRRAVDAMIVKKNKRGGKDAPPDVARQEGIDFLVALSVEITNLELDGEPVNTSDAFRKLWSDESYSWIKTQANELLGDTGAFLK